MKAIITATAVTVLGLFGYYAYLKGSVSKATDSLMSQSAQAAEGRIEELKDIGQSIGKDAKKGSQALQQDLEDRLKEGAKNVDDSLEELAQ
ncbi:hypothetical protein [Rubritalea marina]|uniref:hypothetical protein n=1 Tax=Rubritalea marina TaxID=361055 RepID=UPI00036989C4|nr:hypothetical protein [Rubritalea marina]